MATLTSKTRKSSRAFRDEVIGKRIMAVVARPGRAGEPPTVLMLHFDDGSSVEFLSPRLDEILLAAVEEGGHRASEESMGRQLELMPALLAAQAPTPGLN